MTAVEVEREARRRLPALLSELLQKDPDDIEVVEPASPTPDFLIQVGGHPTWGAEVIASGRSGRVASAARHLSELRGLEPLLVVPYMGKAGAQTAEHHNLNWIDLAGNARIRDQVVFINVRGHPNPFRGRGRPSSPFAPASSRVTHLLLEDPARWWRQVEIAQETGLSQGLVSRVVRRLDEEQLIERQDRLIRPRDPDLLLDAWAEDYRFDAHDAVYGHATGNGIELASDLARRLSAQGARYALTGLPAAWLLDRFAKFRLATIYVEGDPRDALDQVGLREGRRGANVQLLGPRDEGVFLGAAERNGLTVASPVQVYLDLLALPERASEAAEHLRRTGLWGDAG